MAIKYTAIECTVSMIYQEFTAVSFDGIYQYFTKVMSMTNHLKYRSEISITVRLNRSRVFDLLILLYHL